MASHSKALSGLAFVALAVALYLLGTGQARAPQAQLACAAPLDEPASEAGEPLDASQRALAGHLARRYQVATQATELIVTEAYRAGRRIGLDPLLVLAVISIESRFNPVAESNMGAKGLMQIIPRFHLAKLMEHGGEEAVLDPASNIRVGASILQEYVRRTGTLEAGLQFYNGASWDASAQYAQKVMAERARLEASLRRAMRDQARAASADGALGS